MSRGADREIRVQPAAGPRASRPVASRAGVGVLFAALAAAFAVGDAGAAAPESAIDPAMLPPAQTWSDRGVDSELTAKPGSVRVRLILRDQDLLAAAAELRIRQKLQTAPTPTSRRAARDYPARITEGEKAAALEAEGNYEDAIVELQPAADQTSVDIDRVAAKVRQSGGVVLGSEIVPAAVIARVPADELGGLERLSSVQAIAAAPEPRPLSSIGWQAVGAPSWFAAGYTGGTGTSDTVPADAGVSSELPDPTHPAFAGVHVDNDPAPPVTISDHGTHTAGILASGDATNRGVAYGIDRLVNGTMAYQLGFTANGGVPGAPDPVESINVSFGSSQTNDDEGDSDDAITATFGPGQALSAGNENVDGSPTIQNMGRNTMSVGAFNDDGTVDSADDVVLGVSSRGPTPAGRKKPDLTAPGGAVVSADSGWDTPPSNPDYTGMTGTSFSSPHVAGAMTLLEGAGITDPMAQRALLINSARDWNGANTGLHGWTAPQTGWRPEVGWGALNLDAALAQRGYYQLGSVAEGEARFYRATVPVGAKATLAFQLRGYLVGYPGPPFPVQQFKYTQSNLDLRQYRSDDSEVAPPAAWDPPDTTIDPGPDAVDPNDTVEQVRAPATDTITYKVQSASMIDGAAAEPFAIAGAAQLIPLASPTVRPNNLGVDKASVGCNQPIVVTTAARNDSADLAASNAALQIQIPAGVQLLAGDATQIVSTGELATSATSESHSWTVQATSEGTEAITVEGAGDAYGTTFRDGEQVTISADCTPPATAIESGPSGPTNDPTPSFAFSATGAPSSFECSIDGAAFTACSSPHATTALGDGQHSFQVRAYDTVGNVDPTPATRMFTVDTQPPETLIESGPAGMIRSSQASWALAGGSTYECELDGDGFQACSSPASLSGLAQGSHNFAARAIDDAGNVDPTPASRKFAVDRSVAGARVRVVRSVRVKGKLVLNVKVSLGERGSVRVVAVGETGRGRVRLKTASTRLGPGRAMLKLRAGRAANRAIAAATRRSSVRLVVSARFTDGVGNTRTIARVVKVR